MRFARLLILLALAGCSTTPKGNYFYFATVMPQRIELCTTYVLYEDRAAYEAAAPNRRTAGTDETRFLLLDITEGVVKRISFGADDSGGAGFKVLRTPN